MKKLTYLVSSLALALLLSTNVFAQADVNADASVSANIQATLDLTNDEGIDFGTVPVNRIGAYSNSANLFLDPTGAAHRYLGASPNVGKFTLSGGANLPVVVTYDATVELSGSGETLDFIPLLFGNSTDDASASTAVGASGSVVTTNGAGSYWIYVGGGLQNLSDANATGAFSGTFTVTVNYQ